MLVFLDQVCRPALSFVERIYQTYVHSSVCFGLEFVSAGPQMIASQDRSHGLPTNTLYPKFRPCHVM